MTAFQKPGGGVRGIVAGDIVRRLVARTISQQLSSAVESATAPFQYALSTRAGCECVAHALQALGEVDERATIMSIDGITRLRSHQSASDVVRIGANRWRTSSAAIREAVPWCPRHNAGGRTKQGWSTRSTKEKGENKGDAMMPHLFSFGQHNALHAVQERMLPNERPFAFLDDVFVVCLPDTGGRSPCVAGERVVCSRKNSSACGQNEDLQPRRGEDQKRATTWRGRRGQCWNMHECGDEVLKFQRLNVASK